MVLQAILGFGRPFATSHFGVQRFGVLSSNCSGVLGSGFHTFAVLKVFGLGV